MSHTPGPWKAGYWSGQCHIPEHVAARHHPGGKGGCVYDPIFYPMEEDKYGGVSFVGIVNEAGETVVGTEYDALKISMDDARLIAAAPDLVAALKALISYPGVIDVLAPIDSLGSLRALAESAIAKAEGTR
jgi:hypothetical protein